MPKSLKTQLQGVLDCLTPYDVGIPLVRIGGEKDGGYLLPDDLEGIPALFSPGVSENITFDCAVMERGIASFMVDASVDGIEGDHPLADFQKLFLGPKTDGIFISLDDWVNQKADSDSDLLLQMDIEGAEYAALSAASDETLQRFRIMVIEFHGMHRIFRPKYFRAYQAALEKINRHFVAVHLHPNNAQQPIEAGGYRLPSTFEVTFIRRDRFETAVVKDSVANELDRKNIPSLPDYEMLRIWTLS